VTRTHLRFKFSVMLSLLSRKVVDVLF